MEPVENNFSVEKCFMDGQIRAAHLHRHDLPLIPSSCLTLRKIFAFAPLVLFAGDPKGGAGKPVFFNSALKIIVFAGKRIARHTLQPKTTEPCTDIAGGSSAIFDWRQTTRTNLAMSIVLLSNTTQRLICRKTHRIWPDSKEGD